ncbi:MAG: hypothetical protein ACD_73C00786G0004 [uncultured bacterium]|nr:MAG: hypothetical protein ACD_73C00786G0004 [uncultured bacterium]
MPQLKDSNPTLIADILKSTLKNLNIEEKFKVYPLWKQWALVVGETVASKSSPDYIMASKLYVSVTSPAWIQELSFQKQLLLEKIRAFPQLPSISDIVFRLKKPGN